MDLSAPEAQREWLETNSLGGFASGTASGLHTRRYHGLLVASLRPPGERLLLLSKVDETLVHNDRRYELGVNQFPGTLHPRGFEHLESFSAIPFPTWTYRFGPATLRKQLFLVDGQNTVVVSYTWFGDDPAHLELRPLTAVRDYHALSHENPNYRAGFGQPAAGLLRIQPYPSLPALYFGHNAQSVTPAGHWYRNFEYNEERARGLDFAEDLHQPFVLHYALAATPPRTPAANTGGPLGDASVRSVHTSEPSASTTDLVTNTAELSANTAERSANAAERSGITAQALTNALGLSASAAEQSANTAEPSANGAELSANPAQRTGITAKALADALDPSPIGAEPSASTADLAANAGELSANTAERSGITAKALANPLGLSARAAELSAHGAVPSDSTADLSANAAERSADAAEPSVNARERSAIAPEPAVGTVEPGEPHSPAPHAPSALLIVSTAPHAASEYSSLLASERARRAASPSPLARAASQFFVRRAAGATIIAGYPWFTDWGRDTMIALPGLLRATGRRADAQSILSSFARFTDQGMLPNWFPDDGRPAEYNSIDAALWFFEATWAYLDVTGDEEFVRRELYPVLKSIVRWHLRGTRYGIHVDDDGLLAGGAPGVQLTWMDAKIGDWVVTPRHGKPVEIQALWYNALRILETLATRFADPVTRLRSAELADWAALHFEPLFWNPADDCLYDVIQDGQPDPSIRPNQVFAASLTHPLLTGDRARRMLAVVERELLTPLGLRSLSPRDPRYQPRYEGGVRQRDGAYHQGTVWPWLLGPFLVAYRRAHGDSPATRERVALWRAPLERHLAEHGQLPEIADGDAPHTPRGCPAQAWSIAALDDA